MRGLAVSLFFSAFASGAAGIGAMNFVNAGNAVDAGVLAALAVANFAFAVYWTTRLSR